MGSFFKAQVDRQTDRRTDNQTGGQLEAVQQVEIVSPPPQVCAERNIHVHTHTNTHTWTRTTDGILMKCYPLANDQLSLKEL